MSMKKYRVRLVRPVFQVAVVNVDASGEEEAMFEAVCRAELIPDQEWVGEFDPDSYFYDIHCIHEREPTDDDCIFTDSEKDRKYLLLKADTDSGEGEVTFQPWMSEVSGLMLADLCLDWSSQLEELEKEGTTNFFESMEKQLHVEKRAPAKVIPFRRPDGSEGS